MNELLKITDLKLNYGPIAALKGVDISVPKGEIVAILGANGAGKTSLLKVVSGLLKPSAGEILFDGEKIAGKPAYKVAKQGIMQSPEGRFVLVGLTVEENLRVGTYNLKDKDEIAGNFERV
jgi:branched-chain amino acid transport system ATP-binding protein